MMSDADLTAAMEFHRLGRLPEAEHGYRTLIAQNLAPAAVYSNLAAICQASGREEEAEQLFRGAIARQPDFTEAYHNLALCLRERGRADEAAAVLQGAVTRNPDDGRGHHLLGVTLRDQGNYIGAIGALRRAADLLPESHRAYVDLALALRAAGDPAAAAAAARRVIALKPDLALAHHLLGLALKDQGLKSDAAAALRQATTYDPAGPIAYFDLGETLRELAQIEEAAAAFRRAIALQPANPLPYVGLGFILKDQAQFDEATACFRKAVELRPNDPAGHINLGLMLFEQAKLDEAAPAFQRAIALDPKNPHAHSSLIFFLGFCRALPPTELLKVTRRFEEEACPPEPKNGFPFRSIAPRPKIKIGFHSAEIGAHAVAYFLESYLRHYDRTQFEITIYIVKPRNSPKSAELAALVDWVRDISDCSDEEGRRQILADGIDILVDTTGHTARGRLRMLSQRCAPIQCHYIGFVATTGVSAIDYFIGDEEATPPEFESHFSEKIVRLPRLWGAYWPPADVPVPAQESPGGEITFGSFNNLVKVREETLALWASALNAVPDARLLLKDSRCGDPSTRERIAGALEKMGIARSRVEFIAKTPRWADHMRLYNRLDIALDTTPFNSCTTGFDALYMGTPLVAMRGNWMGGRMSSSMLKALGRPEWVASDIREYTKIIRDLSAGRPRLKNHKKTLRAEVLKSPLCDGRALAHDLETAFFRMIEVHNRSRA